MLTSGIRSEVGVKLFGNDLNVLQERARAVAEVMKPLATVLVPAPMDGVITERAGNPGQVVAVGEALFVVTNLSKVWAVGDLYEQNFSQVRAGSDATLTTLAYPGLTLRGRVTYIDPRVDPQARTAKVRVEVANPEGLLQLGMYMTMTFSTASGEPMVTVPRTAVQTIGWGPGGFRRGPG
jgi:RND family efflux transporter MFP subunit